MRSPFHDGSRWFSPILVLCTRVSANGPGLQDRRSAARSGPIALQPRWSHDKVPPEEFCYHTADGKGDQSEATVTDGEPQSRNAREQLSPPLKTQTSIGQASRWRRHFVYRTECLKTTWKFRLAILIFIILIASLTRGFWIPALGRSLTCTEEVGPSDAILVENFDPNYLLFERAAALEKAGLSAKVLVQTEAPRHDPEVANTVSQGIAELMARVARVQDLEIVPTRYIEPISLNAAYQIRDFLTKEHLRSVIVVTPAFRSRRSSLVYRAVLRPAGVHVYCMPVLGEHTPENWTATWHGIEDVTEQFIKLQFYRFYVLPLAGGGAAAPARSTEP